MRTFRYTTLMMLVVLAMLVAACAPKPTATPVPPTPAPAVKAEPTQAPEATKAPATPAKLDKYGDLKVIEVEPGAKIVFSGWGDETEQKIYRDSIERFKQFYPDVTVDFQPIPADFQTKLKAMMAGGTAPDVFYVDDQLMTAFGASGQLLALDDYMAMAGAKRDDFIAPLLTIFTLGGKTYGLPKDWGTLGLVYLPEAFQAAGVPEPTATWTWDDLKKAAEAIQKAGKYGGFCMNADWARFAPFTFGNGGAYANADNTAPALDTAEVKDAAKFVTDLKKAGTIVTSADVGAGWCGEAIGKQLVGMTYEGGWMVNFMRQNYKDVVWKAVPLPTGPKGQADVIFTNAIGVNKATKFPKAAAAFTIFVTSRFNQGEIVKTGFAYSTHPDQLGLVVDANDKAIAQGGAFKLTRVAYWGPNTGKVNDVVSKALERVYLGDQTVDESFAQAQKEAAEFLTGGGAVTGKIEAPAAAAEKVIEVEKGAKIVFSGWGDETEQKIYRDSIVRFNKLYPDVTVDFQPVPADFQTKMKAMMAGGTAPDVMYVDDQLMTAFGASGQLLALDDYMAQAGVKRDDFIPALLTIFTLGGKTYGLPKDWGTLGLVYLPEAFQAAGVPEPTANWTWDDLKKAAEAIQKTGKYGGFCMNADWARFAPFAFGNGGAYATDDAKKATLDTAEVKAAAKFVTDLKKAGTIVTSADVGAGWCGEAIGKKLVGMTYEGGWMVNFMRQNYKDVVWKAVPLPTGPKGQADVIFTNAIGVNAATKFPKAAAAFAIFVTGRANQGEIVKTGFAYSTHPDQIDMVVDANDKAIAQGGTFKLTRVAYWGPNTGKVNDVVSKALERVYLGDQTVDESFAQAQTEAQAALEGK
jgi:multiple sugar transport system substrate-binding protein